MFGDTGHDNELTPLPAANDDDWRGEASAISRQQAMEIVDSGDRLARERDDDVGLSQSRRLGRTSLLHRLHQYA